MNEQTKQLAFEVGIGFLYGDNSAIKSLERFAELVRADERNKHAVNGALVMSFFDGGVKVILRINKSVSVTKKGSIIIKDKKGKGK